MVRFVRTEFAFEHHELVALSEDFGVLLSIAHRRQSQHRGRVGHGQVGQAQQHGGSSCRRSDRLPRERSDTMTRESSDPTAVIAVPLAGRVPDTGA